MFRWTIRLRLTLLYGALFLATGLLLLTVTYVLVAQQPPWSAIEPPKVPDLGIAPPVIGFEEQLARQRSDQLRSLLTSSGISLALMTVLSVWLGWLMAGRALRPLRSMADTAKAISARDLHRRLRVPGPSDEIKDLGDVFDGLLDHLEAAFEAQRRFVANASHELRTPLTYERSLLEIALADPDASAADLREACTRVLGSNERQESLIEALLTLARSQRGLDRRTTLDLAVLAEEYLDLSPVPAGLRVVRDLRPAPTLGDPPLVERLIGNLIDNALRHNVPGGEVAVRTGEDAGRATLYVRNTGPVISPDGLEQIFQPFQRLQATRLNGQDGHGVGLSIVAAIATSHGARINTVPLAAGGLEVRVGFPDQVARKSRTMGAASVRNSSK